MKKKSKGLFDEEFRLRRLSQLRDPLELINEKIDWELFRGLIENSFPKVDYSRGGRPPYDKLILFKVLILQQFYGLSDHGVEYQITDRLSFMRFLGLGLHDRVPDSNTLWNFREHLTKTNTLDALFVLFEGRLRTLNLVVNKGTIVDATIVQVPVQRNSRDENDQIKGGNIPEGWSEKKQSHKDVDADWTKKHGRNYYGYKNHVKIDSESKLITNFETTPASVHDSQVLEDLIDEVDEGQPMYGDSAYRGAENLKLIRKNKQRVQIHHKAKRGQPLTAYKKKVNNVLSKTRCRIEHVFGHRMQVAGGFKVRCIGLVRATGVITLMNLAYNFWRASFLMKSWV